MPTALALIGGVPAGLAAVAMAFLPGLGVRSSRAPLLAGLRLLDGASGPAVERLAAAATEERVPAGQVVLRQGDPADDLYVLVAGTLSVDHDGVGHVTDLAAPDYFGEIGLLQHRPRTATVTTTSEAVLWRIPGAVFLDAVGAGPSTVLAAGMRTRLARTPG